MKAILISAITIMALTLFMACGGAGLDGTYTDKSGKAKYTFNSDGTVQQDMMGIVSLEMNYELEGDKIRIFAEGGGPSVIMTLREDGSIKGVAGMILRPQD